MLFPCTSTDKELPLNTTIDLNILNEFQRKAVEHVENPTLVLAGAGSGKTRALTHKIAYLVSRGVKPWRILAVTFTNKAAREMGSRVEKLLDMPTDRLWIGTFHGICVRILRREAERWGFRRDFTIYDRDDQLAAIKKAMSALGFPKDRLNPRHVLHIIGRAKSDHVTPEHLEQQLSGPDAGLIARVYSRYNELLKAAGAFDFDDLLLRPVEMFGKDPESLDGWQKRFDHILVDEYQDTNHTQYLLIKMLCGESGDVTVVGDDDQSIYSWRGATIRNILEFEKDFKGVKTIRLEQNYRSTKTILQAANALVTHNRSRKPKKLWTDRHAGSPVMVHECFNDMDEAERVIRSMESDITEYSHPLRNFVILYRTNAQSRPFEDVLRRKGMRYIIVGGLRFYERREIKDILAYLRVIANPGDAVSFTRAITTPKRGIGEKTIRMLERFASENNTSLIGAMERAEELFSPGAMLNRVNEFSTLLGTVSDMRGKAGLDKLCSALVEAIDYRAYLEKEFPDAFEDRINNVNELITAMGEYESFNGEDELATFLTEVSLMTDVDTWDDGEDAVTLMTLHSAKGLEFPTVYIAGVERGLFPLPASFEDERMLEEERRLFYVGITRAEERLHVSYAENRARYGSFSGGASMFVDELPAEILKFEHAERFQKWNSPVKNQPIRKVMEFEDYSQEGPDHADDSPFHVGAFVIHPKFGRGEIRDCTGSGENTVLTISFCSGVKKIMPNYVRLAPM